MDNMRGKAPSLMGGPTYAEELVLEESLFLGSSKAMEHLRRKNGKNKPKIDDKV